MPLAQVTLLHRLLISHLSDIRAVFFCYQCLLSCHHLQLFLLSRSILLKMDLLQALPPLWHDLHLWWLFRAAINFSILLYLSPAVEVLHFIVQPLFFSRLRPQHLLTTHVLLRRRKYPWWLNHALHTQIARVRIDIQVGHRCYLQILLFCIIIDYSLLCRVVGFWECPLRSDLASAWVLLIEKSAVASPWWGILMLLCIEAMYLSHTRFVHLHHWISGIALSHCIVSCDLISRRWYMLSPEWWRCQRRTVVLDEAHFFEQL